MKEIIYYTTIDGKCPYIDWRNNLSYNFQSRISMRLLRLMNGNYGDCKRLKNSQLSELRFDFGKGYRIYYTIQNSAVVLLLNAGDKSKQASDIELAKSYIKNLRENENDRF